MLYLLVDEVSGFFSFLNPIINTLEALDHVGLALYTFFEVLLVIPPIEVIYYPLVQLNIDTWYLYLLNVIVFNICLIRSSVEPLIVWQIGRCLRTNF